MIIIGSTAIKHWVDTFREPFDLDMMVRETELGTIHAPYDLIAVSDDVYDMLEHESGIATLDCVYTIKCSHFFIDNKWWKTKQDILQLSNMGCKIIQPLYNALVEYWMNVNPPKFNLSLNKSKDEFFTDKVTYVVDHDYLHELVAYPNRPMYEGLLKDGQEVLIDKNKFDLIDHESKVRLFREEITAIAIERWLINPYWKGKVSWFRAYMLSLKKTIISLTKNWARDFIIMNLVDFVKPNFSYFKHAIKILGVHNMQGSEVIDDIMAVLTSVGIEFEGDRDSLIAETLADGDMMDVERGILQENGFKHIEQEGGGEGGSEYCYSIFEWKGAIYKMEFTYYSHNGYEFDGAEDSIREVQAVEKTITVYQ